MSYIITQIWLYLFLAAILGALIAVIFGACKCNNGNLQAELDNLRDENELLNSRLASSTASGNNEQNNARIALLEAELKKAKKSNGISEEFETMRARNSFLEARVKFLDNNANSNGLGLADLQVSEAGSMSPEELEKAVMEAGDGIQPKAVEGGADADDLLLIDGVGPKNNSWLKENGVHYFRQIAAMNPAELAWLAKNLPNFGSRVYRENWVAQCANLAKGLAPK